MGKNIKILLVISAVVALVCYTYYLNPQNVSVTTKPGVAVEVPLAILMLTLFLAGAMISALLSLLVATRMKFTIWGLEKTLNKISSAESSVKQARGLIALEMYDEAISLLKKVVTSHQFQHSAKALLISTLNKVGKSGEALQLLSASRIEDTDAELLVLCAEINAADENYTAAYDNLSLVLKKEPQNTKALSMMVRATEKLSLIEESIAFQEQLIRQKRASERELAQLRLAKLELKKAVKDSGGADDKLLKEIERILQRHRDFAPALAKRAELIAKSGNAQGATKDLARAYEVSLDVQYMTRLVALWLELEKPAEALTRIEHFTETKDSCDKHPQLLLLLGQLLLHLEMVDPAKQLVKKLNDSKSFSDKFKDQLLLLESLVARRVGKFERAADKLAALSTIIKLPGDEIFPRKKNSEVEETISKNTRLVNQSAYTPA